MGPRWMIAGTLLLAGCAVIHSTLNSATLILKPEVKAGGYGTHTVVPNYTQSSIHHLILKLYTYDGTEHDQGIQKTLLNADLNKVVTFTSLKANTTYRIKAFAYASTDNSNLISTSDANSYTDIPLTTDDHPYVASLKVKLIDRDFNGVATSGIAITPGGYSFAASESWTVPYIVETLAGNGATGSVDGTGTTATFVGPYSLAMDAQNILYVADAMNGKIRKIDSNGVVTTFSPSFGNPSGIAADAQGNIYIADAGTNRILKMTAGGAVSTIAGSGGASWADGTGTAAQFNNPRGVAVDGAGVLYIADYGNHRIRKIALDGTVTTVAGNGIGGFADGTGTSAKLYNPFSVAIDATGNLYVADVNNNRIRKIDTNRVVTTFAGSGTAAWVDGIGTAASFSGPFGVTVDPQGNLYVADEDNNRIRKITSDGVVTTVAGNGSKAFADGIGSSAAFFYPRGVLADSRGNIFVADWQNYRIRRIH